jgi:hypothetical protein
MKGISLSNACLICLSAFAFYTYKVSALILAFQSLPRTLSLSSTLTDPTVATKTTHSLVLTLPLDFC